MIIKTPYKTMLTCEAKIELIKSEPHHVKFLILGNSSIVPILDFLTSDKYWAKICLQCLQWMYSVKIQWIFNNNNIKPSGFLFLSYIFYVFRDFLFTLCSFMCTFDIHVIITFCNVIKTFVITLLQIAVISQIFITSTTYILTIFVNNICYILTPNLLC